MCSEQSSEEAEPIESPSSSSSSFPNTPGDCSDGIWKWDSDVIDWVWTCLDDEVPFDESEAFPSYTTALCADTSSSSSGNCGEEEEENACQAAEETVVAAEDITITYPAEIPAGPGKVIKRDVREKLYILKDMVGKQHHVIVPFEINVKVPKGKTVKIEFEGFLANIDRIRGEGDEEVLKKVSMGKSSFDATGDTVHGGVFDHAKIRDLIAGADGPPPADQLGASNRYGVMIVAYQLAKNPDTGEWTRFYPGSKTYKSIFLLRAITPPSLISDNNILKP